MENAKIVLPDRPFFSDEINSVVDSPFIFGMNDAGKDAYLLIGTGSEVLREMREKQGTWSQLVVYIPFSLEYQFSPTEVEAIFSYPNTSIFSQTTSWKEASAPTFTLPTGWEYEFIDTHLYLYQEENDISLVIVEDTILPQEETDLVVFCAPTQFCSDESTGEFMDYQDELSEDTFLFVVFKGVPPMYETQPPSTALQ